MFDGTDLVTAQVTPSRALYAYEQAPGATRWTRQLVATSAPGGAALSPPSITATATSVQIVSVDANGSIWFFQATDGVIGWSGGQLVGTVSLGNPDGDQVQFWNSEAVTGISSSHPLASPPTIAFTGDNLIFTAVQLMSTTKLRLDSWWQGSPFTDINFEPVTSVVSPKGFASPEIAYTEGASAPQSAVILPFTTNHYSTNGLEAWTVPLDSSTWTKHTVTAP